MSEQDGTQSSIKKRKSRKTNTANQQNGEQTPAAQGSVNDEREAWKTYWETQGQPWRNAPGIDLVRQKYLDERRSIKPDIEQGIYPLCIRRATTLKALHMAQFIGFGGLNVDYSYRVRESFPGGFYPGKEREMRSSPDVLSSQLAHEQLLGTSGGGSAANTMVALSRMGGRTGYIGKVGNDPEGKRLVSELLEVGVDTTHILRGPNRSGIIFALQTLESKDRDMRWFPGDNDTIAHEDIDYHYLNGSDFLHMSSFAGGQSFNTQIEVARRRSPTVMVSLDPGQVYAEKGLPAISPLLEHSDILFPSGEEVEMLTKKGYEEGADELLSYGPQVVCVTLGEKGCYVATREKRIYSPVKEIVPSEKIKDKIGAGDVFAAGFLMGASKRCPLENCAEFANIVAAESIQGSGRNNYPTRFALLNYYISQA